MKLLTTEEAAEILKVDVESVRRFISSGRITAFKVGREWRIKEEDLKVFIERNPNINLKGDKLNVYIRNNDTGY